VVRVLAAEPPPEHRPTELATELAVTTATLTDALQALRRKGLVSDRPDADDGRRKTLQLTRKGRTTDLAIRSELGAFTRAVADLDAPVSSAAVVAMLAIIERLYNEGIVTNDRSCATCAHHRKTGGPHGSCALLGLALSPATLRVRCDEHQPAA
jgi:DNA-binding MarR family transcriptional regulator